MANRIGAVMIPCRMSDNDPFPRDADVPVKSRTSSINWNAKPFKK